MVYTIYVILDIVSVYQNITSVSTHCCCRFVDGFRRSSGFRRPPCWCLLANVISSATYLHLNYNQWPRYVREIVYVIMCNSDALLHKCRPTTCVLNIRLESYQIHIW